MELARLIVTLNLKLNLNLNLRIMKLSEFYQQQKNLFLAQITDSREDSRADRLHQFLSRCKPVSTGIIDGRVSVTFLVDSDTDSFARAFAEEWRKINFNLLRSWGEKIPHTYTRFITFTSDNSASIEACPLFQIVMIELFNRYIAHYISIYVLPNAGVAKSLWEEYKDQINEQKVEHRIPCKDDAELVFREDRIECQYKGKTGKVYYTGLDFEIIF